VTQITPSPFGRQVPAVIERYGGRFLARGGAAELLEGEPAPKRLVIIEFPDRAALRRFYDSPEYQPLVGLRQSASKGRLVAVEGVA
jgi:uncharacterized protein (DUF1330 family)